MIIPSTVNYLSSSFEFVQVALCKILKFVCPLLFPYASHKHNWRLVANLQKIL